MPSRHRTHEIMQSIRTIFELLLNKMVQMKNTKDGTFTTAHFYDYPSLEGLLGNCTSLVDHKSTQKGRLGSHILRIFGEVIAFA